MKPIRIRQYWLGTSPVYKIRINNEAYNPYVGVSEKHMGRIVDKETKRLARLRHVD